LRFISGTISATITETSLSRNRPPPLYDPSAGEWAQVLQRLHEVEGFEIDARADDYGEALIRDRGLDFDRPDRLAAALASEAGFSYASLLSTFRAHEDEQLFYQINPHWTAAGQKLAAEILMPHLQVLLKTSSSVTH